MVGITVFFWYNSKTVETDTSNAYFTCNYLGANSYNLNESEKQELKNLSMHYFFKGTPGNIRVSEECYKVYSGGKEAKYASEFSINLFKSMNENSDGKVYTISGIEHYDNWHVDEVLIALLIELVLMWIIKYTGLYIFGGREAI